MKRNVVWDKVLDYKEPTRNKLSVIKMNMLRWMCRKTVDDMIRKENIRVRVGVSPIVKKMVKTRLRWFDHLERRLVHYVVRRLDKMKFSQITRGRGRRRKPIREPIKKVLEKNEFHRNMVYDRTL
jgi:hypothetical protein